MHVLWPYVFFSNLSQPKMMYVAYVVRGVRRSVRREVCWSLRRGSLNGLRSGIRQGLL